MRALSLMTEKKISFTHYILKGVTLYHGATPFVYDKLLCLGQFVN